MLMHLITGGIALAFSPQKYFSGIFLGADFVTECYLNKNVYIITRTYYTK